jgi:uncharacterized damage-inducible protein DinB
MKRQMDRMLRAMTWADRQVLAAVPHDLALQGEVLPLLAHLLAAEHIWLLRIYRRPARFPVRPSLTLAECERLARENAAGYAGLLRTFSESDLQFAVPYRTTSGEECATPIIDILTHVVTHGAYHRGQIAKALRRAGVTPVDTDFITFARIMEPALVGSARGEALA